jgi:flagellar export protein FliJ
MAHPFRFTRLVELRRIKEELAGSVVAKSVAQVESLRQRIADLDRESVAAEAEIRAAIVAGGSSAAGQSTEVSFSLYEGFQRGQAWRRQRLEQELARARQEMEEAYQAWYAVRAELKQVERLHEKEEQAWHLVLKQRETKELDAAGMIRYRYHEQ